MRAFSEPVVRAHLGDAAAGIVGRLYDRVRERLAAEPRRYTLHYVAVVVRAARRPRTTAPRSAG